MTPTTMTLATIPETDTAIEAQPSLLALGAFDTALLLATTAQTRVTRNSRASPGQIKRGGQYGCGVVGVSPPKSGV